MTENHRAPRRPRGPLLPGVLSPLLLLWGCGGGEAPTHQDPEPPPPTNRIAVPAAVRQNLGIEFVAVERRRVAATLRVPGHFELLPQGRREYRTPLAGRVEVLVAPLQRVAGGAVLYTIDAPEWHRLRRELGELVTAQQVAEARVATMSPLLAAHEQHEQTLEDAVAVMQQRIAVLEETARSIGGQGEELASARVQLAQVQADLAEAGEKHAELQAMVAATDAEVAAGRERFQLALATAASISQLDVAALTATDDHGAPGWRRMTALSVRAAAAGVVDALPLVTGAWAEVGDLVAAVTDPLRVQFRARGLQSDLPRLREGLPARVVPASGDPRLPPIAGALLLGVTADPAQRTIDLFVQPAAVPEWARPGVAAFVEVETAGGGEAELAIPTAAVLQDGLSRVYFRRDHKDPDQVIRTEADLGVDDGRWVEVKSGLADGDAVVLAGAYELMLASSGQATKGGHFHADGTFHENEDH